MTNERETRIEKHYHINFGSEIFWRCFGLALLLLAFFSPIIAMELSQ